MLGRLPVRRTFLAVDVEGFTRPERDGPSRSMLRDSLFRVIEQALQRSGVENGAWTRLDTGDGACYLLDPEISEVVLLERCLTEMGVGLKDFNRGRLAESMLRLRVVLHSGHVVRDDYGWSGQELNIAFRLLDSEPLRAALRAGAGPLAVMVSDAIYDGVVRDGWRILESGDWELVDVRVKQWSGHAWLYAPDRHADRRAVTPDEGAPPVAAPPADPATDARTGSDAATHIVKTEIHGNVDAPHGVFGISISKP
jgi:class 3 adenylate cyclase